MINTYSFVFTSEYILYFHLRSALNVLKSAVIENGVQISRIKTLRRKMTFSQPYTNWDQQSFVPLWGFQLIDLLLFGIQKKWQSIVRRVTVRESFSFSVCWHLKFHDFGLQGKLLSDLSYASWLVTCDIGPRRKVFWFVVRQLVGNVPNWTWKGGPLIFCRIVRW